jgi:hypothetical protein
MESLRISRPADSAGDCARMFASPPGIELFSCQRPRLVGLFKSLFGRRSQSNFGFAEISARVAEPGSRPLSRTKLSLAAQPATDNCILASVGNLLEILPLQLY